MVEVTITKDCLVSKTQVFFRCDIGFGSVTDLDVLLVELADDSNHGIWLEYDNFRKDVGEIHNNVNIVPKQQCSFYRFHDFDSHDFQGGTIGVGTCSTGIFHASRQLLAPRLQDRYERWHPHQR